MKKTIRSGSFFAKAEGALSWKDRLAKMRGKGKAKPTAKLEIDDATGETLVFPEIGDVSEIAEGVAVTATDGDHVFTADATTYTVTVLDGVITAVVEVPTEEEAAAEAMSEETVEFIEAVAEALEVNEAFRATAQAAIDKLTTDLATAVGTIANLRATMTHKGDGTGDDGNGGAGAGATGLKINGKPIDLSKINLNSKK